MICEAMYREDRKINQLAETPFFDTLFMVYAAICI